LIVLFHISILNISPKMDSREIAINLTPLDSLSKSHLVNSNIIITLNLVTTKLIIRKDRRGELPKK